MSRGRGRGARGGRRGGGRAGSSGKQSSTTYVVVKKVSQAGKGGKGQTPKGKNAGVHKKKTPVGKRGGSRGRGRGGRGRGGQEKKTAEQLDAEMDAYFLKDEKTAAQKLNNDLDDYWKNKPADEEMAD